MAEVASKTKASPGYKGQRRIGSLRGQVRRIVDAQGKAAAHEFAAKKRIKPGTARTWINSFAKAEKAPSASYIGIRDLQKISGETIQDLRGPTPIKSGGRTVGILVPLKAADPDRLAAVLARAEALARGRDAERDDEALKAFSDVDPVNWSVEEVRKLMAETRKR